jgi:hypothetical protein
VLPDMFCRPVLITHTYSTNVASVLVLIARQDSLLEPVSFAYDPEVYLNGFQLLINELWHNGDAG